MDPGGIAGISVAVGEIAEVFYKPAIGVFLNVDLVHYHEEDGTEAGRPLQATVRWCPSYHGVGYGDWHIPDVGQVVLCHFPGVTQDGIAGDDLENGYATAYVSSSEEPPVAEGIDGDIKAPAEANSSLSVTRRIYTGKPGVDHDSHYQGDVDELVDGRSTRKVLGQDILRVVGGAVARFESSFFYVVESTLQFWGFATVLFQASEQMWFRGFKNLKFTSVTDTYFSVGETLDIDVTGDVSVDSSSGNHHTGALSIEEIASVEYNIKAEKLILGNTAGTDDVLLILYDLMDIINAQHLSSGQRWTEVPALLVRAQDMRT
jgi:hypothetical protein